jgi:hypothetical protein
VVPLPPPAPAPASPPSVPGGPAETAPSVPGPPPGPAGRPTPPLPLDAAASVPASMARPPPPPPVLSACPARPPVPWSAPAVAPPVPGPVTTPAAPPPAVVTLAPLPPLPTARGDTPPEAEAEPPMPAGPVPTGAEAPPPHPPMRPASATSDSTVRIRWRMRRSGTSNVYTTTAAGSRGMRGVVPLRRYGGDQPISRPNNLGGLSALSGAHAHAASRADGESQERRAENDCAARPTGRRRPPPDSATIEESRGVERDQRRCVMPVVS